MIKPLRKNVLVDCGPLADQLGAMLIITPHKYKRIRNTVKILAVGSQCRLFDQSSIGKEVIIEVVHDLERRYSPETSVKYGLKPHWHFMVPERFIQVLLDK